MGSTGVPLERLDNLDQLDVNFGKIKKHILTFHKQTVY